MELVSAPLNLIIWSSLSKTQFNMAYIGEFFQGGFFFLEVVTFFVTLRADLEDYFKCKT